MVMIVKRTNFHYSQRVCVLQLLLTQIIISSRPNLKRHQLSHCLLLARSSSEVLTISHSITFEDESSLPCMTLLHSQRKPTLLSITSIKKILGGKCVCVSMEAKS